MCVYRSSVYVLCHDVLDSFDDLDLSLRIKALSVSNFLAYIATLPLTTPDRSKINSLLHKHTRP